MTKIFNSLCDEEDFERCGEDKVAAAAERLRQIGDQEDDESEGSENEQNESKGNHEWTHGSAVVSIPALFNPKLLQLLKSRDKPG